MPLLKGFFSTSRGFLGDGKECGTHSVREQISTHSTRTNISHKLNNVNRQEKVKVICSKGKTSHETNIPLPFGKDWGTRTRKIVINLCKKRNFICCKSVYKKNHYYLRKMANLLKPETSWGKRSVRTQGINKHGKRKMTKLNIEIAKRKLTRAANMARERFSNRELSDQEFSDRKFSGRKSEGWRFSNRKFSKEYYQPEGIRTGCTSVYPKPWNGEVEIF